MKRFIPLFLGLWLAQALAVTGGDNPFTPYTTTHKIAVSNVASAAEQLDTVGNCTQYKLENQGSSDVWVGFGTAGTYTVTAPAAGVPAAASLVKAGATTVVTQIAKAYVSSITESGTSTLDVTCGVGVDAGQTSSNVTATGTMTTTPGTASQSITSSTITTGGTFQQIAASSTTRKSYEFVNICGKSGNCTATTNNCYLFVGASGTPSTGNSIVVPPGGGYLRSAGSIPTNAIQATCDGNGDKYYLSVQ